jgi:hypothetical protein
MRNDLLCIISKKKNTGLHTKLDGTQKANEDQEHI